MLEFTLSSSGWARALYFRLASWSNVTSVVRFSKKKKKTRKGPFFQWSFSCDFLLWDLKRLVDLFCCCLLIYIPDVTLPRLKAFIPQLLSRLHIEALLHGNITKEVWKPSLLQCIKWLRPQHNIQLHCLKLNTGVGFIQLSEKVVVKGSWFSLFSLLLLQYEPHSKLVLMNDKEYLTGWVNFSLSEMPGLVFFLTCQVIN